MKKVFLFAASTLAIASASNAAVVINEIFYDGASTDVGEYIELYNNGASAVDISGWNVVMINGANGNPYTPAITIPAATSLAADGYYVIGSATDIDGVYGVGTVDLDISLNNALQNGGPDAVVLYDAGAVRQDSLAYEADSTFVVGTVAQDAADATAEGGTGRTVSRTLADTTRNITTSRVPNGVDTDSNALDFMNAPATPGAANVVASLPITDSFTGTFNAAWRGGFVENRVVDGVTALGVASADGGDVLEVRDVTGGGDTAFLPLDESVINFEGEIFIPADNASAPWSTGVGVGTRSESTWFSTFTANGLETGFYLEYQNGAGVGLKAIPDVTTAEARLVAVSSIPTINTGAVTGATFEPLGSTSAVNKGAWNTFRVFWDRGGNRLYGEINGMVIYDGVVPAGTYNNSGGVVVGFRENHTGTPVVTAPNEGTYVDGITINTTAPPVASVTDWMTME